MITLSFWGHRFLYDENIAEKVCNTFSYIFQQDSEFTVYTDDFGDFYKVCKDVLTKSIQKEYADKSFSLFRVVADNTFALRQKDEPVICPISFETIQYHIQWQRMKKWIIEKSDYIVCYIYKEIEPMDYKDIDYAIRLGKNVFNLTSEETRKCFIRKIDILPERDKYIITQRNLGIPRSAIGKKLGISGSRVGQIEAKARHRLIRLQIHE